MGCPLFENRCANGWIGSTIPKQLFNVFFRIAVLWFAHFFSAPGARWGGDDGARNDRLWRYYFSRFYLDSNINDAIKL
jgi:hypothetical protein